MEVPLNSKEQIEVTEENLFELLGPLIKNYALPTLPLYEHSIDVQRFVESQPDYLDELDILLKERRFDKAVFLAQQVCNKTSGKLD